MPVDNFFLSEFLQPLVQPDVFQLLALPKRARLHVLNAHWEDNLFKTTIGKAPCSDLLESVRKLDILQTSAVIKHPVPDALESFGKEYFRKIAALPKRPVPYCLQPALLLERDLL